MLAASSDVTLERIRDQNKGLEMQNHTNYGTGLKSNYPKLEQAVRQLQKTNLYERDSDGFQVIGGSKKNSYSIVEMGSIPSRG